MAVRPEDAGIVGIEFVFATPADQSMFRLLQSRRDYRTAEEYRSALYLTLDNGAQVRIVLPARFEERTRETLAAQLEIPGFARTRTGAPIAESEQSTATGHITADEFEAAVARIQARMVPRVEPLPSQADDFVGQFPRFVKKNRTPTPVPVERTFVREADLDPHVRKALQGAPPGHWVGNRDQAFRYDADGPGDSNVEIGKPGPDDALKLSFIGKPNAWKLLTDPPPIPASRAQYPTEINAVFKPDEDVEQHIEDAANRCTCPACQRTGQVLDRQRDQERGWILYSETRGVQREDLTTTFYPFRESAERARTLRGVQGLVVAQTPEYWAIRHRGHRQFMTNDAPDPSVAIFPNYDSAVAALPPEGMIVPYPALWAIVREDGYPLYADSTETTLRTWTSDDAATAYARGLTAEEGFNWRAVPGDEALPPAPRAISTDRWILRNLNNFVQRNSAGVAQVYPSFEAALTQSEILAAQGESWRIERPDIWTLRARIGGRLHAVGDRVVPYGHYVQARSAANLLHDTLYDPEPGYPE
jgi:hypothetical protein